MPFDSLKSAFKTLENQAVKLFLINDVQSNLLARQNKM